MDMPVADQFQALSVVVLMLGIAWTLLVGLAWVVKRTWRIIARL